MGEEGCIAVMGGMTDLAVKNSLAGKEYGSPAKGSLMRILARRPFTNRQSGELYTFNNSHKCDASSDY